jgi:hypothetical protein
MSSVPGGHHCEPPSFLDVLKSLVHEGLLIATYIRFIKEAIDYFEQDKLKDKPNTDLADSLNAIARRPKLEEHHRRALAQAENALRDRYHR